MKKIVFCLSLLCSSSFLFAAKVDLMSAQKVAEHFLYSRLPGEHEITLECVKTVTSMNSQEPLLYVFNRTDKSGFVIVSANDLVKPIVGYALDHRFSNGNISPQLAEWFGNMQHQITNIVKYQKSATQVCTDQWKSLTDFLPDAGNVAAKPTGVAPMLSSTWDQINDYRMSCPANAPAGSVAVAMGQVMHFWQHPTTGTGSYSYTTSTLGGTLSANFGTTTYDWANMPDALTSSSTSIEKAAVATLLFHCGVATATDYMATESFADMLDYGGNRCAERAFKNNFGYSITATGYNKSDFSTNQWHEMLKFEIDNGRPLLYSGYNDVPVTFVIDGYDDLGYFHINWGWGGLSDGYFELDDLNPAIIGTGGGMGDYNFSQEALVMIQPAGSTLPQNPYTPDYIVSIQMNSEINTSADTIAFYTPYSLSAELKNVGPDSLKDGMVGFIYIDESNNGLVKLAGPINLAPDSVYNYSFETMGDSTFTVGTHFILMTYSKLSNDDNISLYFPEENNYSNSTFLTVVTPLGLHDVPSVLKSITVYPNPATRKITIDTKDFKGKILNISMQDLSGRDVVILNRNISPISTQLELPVLTEGIYLLRIQSNLGNLTQKIVIGK